VERMPVSSTSVASIGYDGDSRVLEVEFLNGRVYQYVNVPPATHAELMESGSKGRFINQFIKPMFAAIRVG
jgi:KTSC domain